MPSSARIASRMLSASLFSRPVAVGEVLLGHGEREHVVLVRQRLRLAHRGLGGGTERVDDLRPGHDDVVDVDVARRAPPARAASRVRARRRARGPTPPVRAPRPCASFNVLLLRRRGGGLLGLRPRHRRAVRRGCGRRRRPRRRLRPGRRELAAPTRARRGRARRGAASAARARGRPVRGPLEAFDPLGEGLQRRAGVTPGEAHQRDLEHEARVGGVGAAHVDDGLAERLQRARRGAPGPSSRRARRAG